MEQIVKTYIGSISIGQPQVHNNLCLFPLVSGQRDSLDYLTLEEALNGQVISVAEVSEGGSVPELSVLNTSGRMVLILDGEEVVGAKQNRIVNTTILVAAGAKTVIPVSCVEQGRWTYDTPEFRSEGRVMASKMRASKAEQVKFSLRTSGEFASDQGAIWGEIRDLLCDMEAESPSAAMSAVYRKERPRLEEYARRFGPVEGQVGAVFAINGRVAGMDCFGKPETFAKVLRKLVESYALDALDRKDAGASDDPETAKAAGRFVRGAAACRLESRPSVGLGTDCRLESAEATGFALVHEGQLLHMSLFTKRRGASEGEPSTRMARFSQRRSRTR